MPEEREALRDKPFNASRFFAAEARDCGHPAACWRRCCIVAHRCPPVAERTARGLVQPQSVVWHAAAHSSALRASQSTERYSVLRSHLRRVSSRWDLERLDRVRPRGRQGLCPLDAAGDLAARSQGGRVLGGWSRAGVSRGRSHSGTQGVSDQLIAINEKERSVISTLRSEFIDREAMADGYPASASVESSFCGTSHSLPHLRHLRYSPRALVNFTSAPK
jgi:hypothetical protein